MSVDIIKPHRLRATRLPSSVCLIADRFTDATVQEALLEAVEAGIRWVQLRDHQAPDELFRREAWSLVNEIRHIDEDVSISINARLGTAEAQALNFHTGRRGPRIAEVRSRLSRALVGYSAHDAEDAARAKAVGADYITFSPIFPTASKPDARPAGLASLRQVVTAVDPLPVLALGGIDASNAAACLEAGAAGVAVIGAVLRQRDIARAVRNLLEAVGSAG